MVNIVFLGAAGSGKGTQASLLAEKFYIPAISLGDLLRKEVEEKSKTGQLATSYMQQGKLVPDELVTEVIKNRITKPDCDNGFILDGFPRSLNQAKVLDAMLKSINKKIDLVFEFKADEEVLFKRITGRFCCKDCGEIYNRYFKDTTQPGVCDKCTSTNLVDRSDDKEEKAIKNRLQVFKASNGDIVKYYQKKDLIYSVDALKDVAFIFERLVSKINSFAKKN